MTNVKEAQISLHSPSSLSSENDKIKTTKSSKKSTIIGQIFESTEFHGFADWHNSHSVLKVVWTLILLTAIVAFVFEFYTVFAKFLAREKVSNIDLVDNSTDGLQFPHITICPLNRIDMRQQAKVHEIIDKDWLNRTEPDQLFESAGEMARDVSGLNSVLGSTSTIWSMLGGSMVLDPQVQLPPLLLNITEAPELPWTPRDITEYFKRVGYSIQDLFAQCAFSSNPIDCNEFIDEIFDRDYGKCFTIKAPPQLAAGLGLSMALDLRPFLAYPSEPNIFEGVVLKIGKSYDPGDYEKMMIPLGSYNLLDLSLQEVNLFENCGGKRAFQILNAEYSTGACHMDCEQEPHYTHALIAAELVLSACQCLLPFDRLFLKPDLSHVDLCDTPDQRQCAFNETRHNVQRVKQCVKQYCNVPCVSSHYRVEKSAVPFPSPAYSNSVDQRTGPTPPLKADDLVFDLDNGTTITEQFNYPDYEDPQYLSDLDDYNRIRNNVQKWKEGYIVINIAYSQLHYTVVTQQLLMTSTILVSNIGGQIGLWLGGSVISIIKILLLLLTVAFLRMTTARQNGTPERIAMT